MTFYDIYAKIELDNRWNFPPFFVDMSRHFDFEKQNFEDTEEDFSLPHRTTQTAQTALLMNLEEKIRRHNHDGIETEKINNGVERIAASFETGEQYTLNLYVPFAIRIVRVRGRTIKAIAATDDGTITVKNANGDTTATLTASASTAINTDLTAVVPTANNLIAKDSYYSIVSAKTTDGGKVMISVEWERI